LNLRSASVIWPGTRLTEAELRCRCTANTDGSEGVSERHPGTSLTASRHELGTENRGEHEAETPKPRLHGEASINPSFGSFGSPTGVTRRIGAQWH
jgi:hypothetical protein